MPNDDVIIPQENEDVVVNDVWTVGEDIVPSVYYQAFSAHSAWNADDESVYKAWIIDGDPSEVEGFAGPAAEIDLIANPVTTEPGDDEDEPAETNVRELLNIGANKWGVAAPNEAVAVEITPNEDLEENYPDVNVIIDGKEYAGLGILSKPVVFNMDKDHRIVIDWAHGEVYESFRIVANR